MGTTPDAEPDRDGFRRSRSMIVPVWVQGAACLIVGVIVAVGGGLHLGRAVRHRDHLIAVGTAVPGEVVANGRSSGRGPDIEWIHVAYTVDGNRYDVSLTLLPTSPRLRVGDRLTVYLDPRRPDQAVARGFDVPDEPLTVFAALGIALGVVLVPAGIVVLSFCGVARTRQRHHATRPGSARSRRGRGKRTPRPRTHNGTTAGLRS